jgi:drug/metabolite transporter (DMT)-like permease
MTDFIVPTVMTVAIFVGILAWVVLTRRPAIRMQRLVLVLGVGLASIGLFVAVRFALPESVRPVAVALLGLALSGLLIGLAVVYRDRLPPGQTRHMILFGVVGAVLTVLGLLTD